MSISTFKSNDSEGYFCNKKLNSNDFCFDPELYLHNLNDNSMVN